MQFVLDNLNMIVTASVFGTIGLIALWCFVTGLKRGTVRSVIRLLTVVISAAIAIFAVSAISTTVLPMVEPAIKDYVVNFLSGLNPAVADAINSSADLVNYILELVTALLTPTLFTVLFLTLLLLTMPVYWILKLFVPKRDGVHFASRLSGACIALLGAVVISLCVMMPVAGYAGFVSEEYPTVKETGLVPEGVIPAQLDAQLVSTKDNLAVKTVNMCGGGILFNAMIKVGDSNVKTEVDYVLETVGVALPAVQQLMDDNAHVMGTDQLQPVHLDALRDTILPQLEKSPIRIRSIMAEILSVGATKWTNDETFLGVNLGELLGAEIAESVTILLEDLAVTKGESITADLREFSITAEDLSECLACFKQIQEDNPTELVAAGRKKLDLSTIRDEVLPRIDTSEAAEVERRFLADVMQKAATKWQGGETYLDVDMKTILGNFGGSGDMLLVRLANTDADHVVEDLRAVSIDMEVLSQTYVYFVDMRDSLKSADQLKDSLTTIVTDMTPEAVEVIKSTLTSEISDTVDIKEKDAVVELVGNAFENVTALPVEEREKEAEALNQVLNYATGNTAEEEGIEQEVVDAMLGSTAISTTIIDTVNKNNDPTTADEDKTQISVTEEQKAQLEAAIDSKLAADSELPPEEQTLTAEQKAMLESLKQLFVAAP